MSEKEIVKDKKFYIRCDCSATDHMVSIMQFNDGSEHDDAHIGQCLVQTSMNHYLPWYKRLVVGVKYIFGGSDGSHYKETLVDVRKLKEVVNSLDDFRPEDIEDWKAQTEEVKIV